MAFRSPAPVNQFYRIAFVDGEWRKTTRWNTPYDNVNCMAAQGAVALDAHTDGMVTTTPPRIRQLQFDQTGGIGVDDVRTAWYRGWNKTLLTPAGFSWGDTIAAVREGRYVILAVDYDAVPYSFRAQKSFLGDHAMGINQIRSDGLMQVYDSLGTDPKWMPQYALRAAAEKIALRVRGSRYNLFVGLTRARAPLNQYAGWGKDVPVSIKGSSTVPIDRVRAAIRKAGLNYGSFVNMVDLAAALRRARINYGTTVNLIDVQALLRWAA